MNCFIGSFEVMRELLTDDVMRTEDMPSYIHSSFVTTLAVFLREVCRFFSSSFRHFLNVNSFHLLGFLVCRQHFDTRVPFGILQVDHPISCHCMLKAALSSLSLSVW